MERRTKFALFAALVLLVLALLLWLLLSLRTAPAPEAPAAPAPSAPTALPGGGTTAAVAPPTPTRVTAPAVREADPAASLLRLASAFAERYGSYSTLGDYENQTDLLPLMSRAFASRTEANVAALRSRPQPSAYYGVTTRAIKAATESFDGQAGVAVIVVATQRRETDAAGTETVKYQDITLGFVKEDGAWKADTAKWD